MDNNRLKYFIKFFILAYLFSLVLGFFGLNGPIGMVAMLLFCYLYSDILDWVSNLFRGE